MLNRQFNFLYTNLFDSIILIITSENIMGYDVSVKFKTEKDKEKMKRFLVANCNILKEIELAVPHNPVHDRTPYDGEDLGYAPEKKFLLGFHGTGIPEYIWKLCAWMSVKAGAKDTKGNHYFYYDDEKMLVTFDLSNKQNTVVDQNGISVEHENNGLSKKISDVIFGTKKAKQKQRELFLKLNDNWDEINLQNNESLVKTKKIKP